jgi:hypothetical protein
MGLIGCVQLPVMHHKVPDITRLRYKTAEISDQFMGGVQCTDDAGHKLLALC